MKPELKKQWVDALRSGEYKQGIGYLRTGDNKFCCLGVLLDIIYPNSWDTAQEGQQDDFVYMNTVTGEAETLNGLEEELGLFDETVSVLIDMNDGKSNAGLVRQTDQKTFKEIADWIEENPAI